MTINIMNQFIDMTKEQINSYMRFILGNEFNEHYCDLFIEKYINVRYYNFYEDDISGTLRKKILKYLKETEEDIMINNMDDRTIVERMSIFFYYILYFDNVIAYKDLHQKIDKIEKLCDKMGVYKQENFHDRLFEIVNDWIITKDIFLDNFNTDEFFIKKSHYANSVNVYRVNLQYNIQFPVQYSDLIIKKTFNTGITNEDKLPIEYYLTVVQVIRDITNQKLNRQYIVEFTDSILKKNKKLENLLNIITNSMIQEKICIKIRYENFIENKETIYELMRRGYGIAVILDGAYLMDSWSIETLRAFRFVIANPSLPYYKEFMRRSKNVLKNVLEI